MSMRAARPCSAAVGVVAAVTIATTSASASRTGSFAAPVARASAVATRAVEIPTAFARPARAVDLEAANHPEIREAIAVLTHDDPGVPESWKPGRPAGDLRVLLAGLGESARSIFAFTTSRGRLCAGLTGFTSGCFSELPRHGVDFTVGDPDNEGSGEGAIVWGLASSDVVAVKVLVDGRVHAAPVASNAYFFQAPPAVLLRSLERLEVRRADGAVEFVPLGTGPRLPAGFGG